jgi:predicted amidohydrolase
MCCAVFTTKLPVGFVADYLDWPAAVILQRIGGVPLGDVMKIGLAQIQSSRGDMRRNLERHQLWIELATAEGADLLVFPELSITGYEPTLAKTLATTPDDRRFDGFQQMSDRHQLMIAIGVPIQSTPKPHISLVIFHPHQPRQVYAKHYLHADEEPFFTAGQNARGHLRQHPQIALAICYELSVADHAATAIANGAEVYLASVAKSAEGVNKAALRLAEIAQHDALLTLMVNCVGPCEDFVGAGQSAVWDRQGRLMGRLNGTDEGLLVIDTDTQAVIEKRLEVSVPGDVLGR